MQSTSDQFNSQSIAFIEEVYIQYLRDPSSVSDDWRSYFDQLRRDENGQLNQEPRPTFKPSSIFNPPGRTRPESSSTPARPMDPADRSDLANLQDRVDQLVRNFRVRGHRAARIDPLRLEDTDWPELNPGYVGFSESDLDLPFSSRTMAGADKRSLREIIRSLRNTYCRSIGVQFMHIDDPEMRVWLQQRMESTENRLNLSSDEQKRIFTQLTDALIFEEFIQKKYTGAKSFSLQGAESLIPLLDLMIERSSEQGVREIVLGMAHRGRLNVLANIMRKNPKQIFREFDDVDAAHFEGRGDVKYHLGYSCDFATPAGDNVHLSLCFNPSHLEFVNPVVLGRLRAKVDLQYNADRMKGLAILIHGDAAFAGEGVVQETLNLSELPAYEVGGAIHVILNNQIGFTTGPREARSCIYATDVAKMLQVPIFHVNGEDPEAVAQVVHLAVDFRMKFNCDVVIDLYCYRRFGHNEGDEPMFTQPVLYKAIKERKSVREGYLARLTKLGGITRKEADVIADERHELLEKELASARSEHYERFTEEFQGVWSRYKGGPATEADNVETGISEQRLTELLMRQSELPDDFHPHPKIERLMKTRRQIASGKKAMDWAAAEALAMGSLVTEGVRVRLSGQDCGRGTFSHRHAVLHDYLDGHRYLPLLNMSHDQAPIEIYNSPLSETGVIGFEYGYSLDCPNGLVMWEAQFGDFVNAGQVIIDQFVVSAECKWNRLSGLVFLLPHGLEGAGPEHSSARIERWLAQSAEDNIQIAYPTTPAQFFHLLRRQVLRPWRKPLVVFTPKSLLRHPRAVSSLEDCAHGSFQRIIPDVNALVRCEQIKRVLICTGKIYYELDDYRRENDRDDVAILRLEQLYPRFRGLIAETLEPYKNADVFWVQEEPRNMGGWRSTRAMFGRDLFERLGLTGITRPESSSPATGSASSHKLEQQDLIERAFNAPPYQG